MEIRCPHCGKKLGDRVLGLYQTQCPRCHSVVRMVMKGREIVSFRGEKIEIVAKPAGEGDGVSF